MRSPRVPMGVAMALWAIAGCGDRTPGAAGGANVCDAEHPCRSGALCQTDLNACVSPPAARDTAILRIAWADALRRPPQVATVMLDDPLDVVLPALVSVPLDVPDGGEVVLSSVEDDFVDKPRGVFGVGPAGAVAVPPGWYAVDARSEYQGYRLPPRRTEAVWLAQDSLRDVDGTPMAWDALAPRTTGLVTVTGTAWWENRLKELRAAVGMEVVAVDAATREPVSSTAQVTCPTADVCGRFSLAVLGGYKDLLFAVSHPDQPFHPTYVVPVSLFDTAEVELRIPELSAPEPVSLMVRTPTGESPGRCRVRITAQGDDGWELDYVVYADATGRVYVSAEGEAEVPALYPGSYQVTASPVEDGALDAAFGAPDEPVPFTVTAGKTASVQVLLQAKRPVTIAVTADGEPVADATVFAVDVAQRTWLTSRRRTDRDGALTVWLDDASYVLGVRPPPALHRPWGIVVWESGQEREELSVDLGLPVYVFGTVRIADDPDAAVGGSVITWYRTLAGIDVPVAVSVVDADGGYQALIPAP